MTTLKPRILSGIQPSGKLHIGNYLGALKNFVELQNSGKYDCYFFIADYHSITEDYESQRKREQILDLVLDFFAAGLDPERSTVFLQSAVSQHTELAWIFSSITPVSELERMTQYKDKSSRQAKNINVGLLTYPVLQAADVLLYKPYAVPVGRDQEQHLELTRKTVRWFNNRFGETFVEPKTLLTEVPKVMSLLDPEKKMSKSLGDKHCVYLSDEPDVIEQKIKKAVAATDGLYKIGITDTASLTSQGERLGSLHPEYRGGINLFRLLSIFDSNTADKILSGKNYQYSAVKSELSAAIARTFENFRKNRKKLTANLQYLTDALETGGSKAQKIADSTLQEVKQKIGLKI